MHTHLNTIFRYCNDVVPMRHFYTELLGLAETFYRNDDEHGWLTYRLGDVQLVFIRAQAPLPVATEFALQPGYEGGTLPTESWVIQLTIEEWTAVLQRLQSSDVLAFTTEPIVTRTTHKQFIVRDPMGFTVEVFADFAEEETNG